MSLDIVQTDIVVDVLAEPMDVAIRDGALKSFSLVVRKLGETALMIFAAPSYLKRYGKPRSIADFEAHNRSRSFGLHVCWYADWQQAFQCVSP